MAALEGRLSEEVTGPGLDHDPAMLDYPEATVLKYYLAIAGRDYQAAYDLLGTEMRSESSCLPILA